jgi:hypothetical protein
MYKTSTLTWMEFSEAVEGLPSYTVDCDALCWKMRRRSQVDELQGTRWHLQLLEWLFFGYGALGLSVADWNNHGTTIALVKL